MPGLIHSVLIKEGDVLSKGDSVLILEAMKMENIIKAPADVVIKKINVEPKSTVDKGEIMVVFE